MITKVLIANRGEIAVRIIRACRELNIQTVAIYSNVDKDSLHVLLADESVCIGDHTLAHSYLDMNAIISAAISTGANAIHPGFGFLSERAEFAKLCATCGITFIGPTSEVIELMGDKARAKQTMLDAQVPCVLGSDGVVVEVSKALEIAQSIGYPVLIKASAGGGGKGMRICRNDQELLDGFPIVRQEAQTFFNNPDVYLEKFVEHPRHIEVQIMADTFGNVIHLFERECSIQRNNQKMIEEGPVTNLKQSTRDQLHQAAVNAAKHTSYVSAGTIEFIMDAKENFYFIEMNTRIQVEHPVTEMITGLDLIKEQILIAEGKPLSVTQEDVVETGHAIELRINAENPYENFRPCAGAITSLHWPGGNGVRVDSHIYHGYRIPPFYDSMIGKIIVHGKNRDEAIEKAIRSLEEMDCEGIDTNIEFILEVILTEPFLDQKYTTSTLMEIMEGKHV